MFRQVSNVIVAVVLVTGGSFSMPGCNSSKELTVDLGTGVKLEMVLIPAGEFMMGTPDSDMNAWSKWLSEKPQHRTRIDKPFYLGKYLVTRSSGKQSWAATRVDSKVQRTRWNR